MAKRVSFRTGRLPIKEQSGNPGWPESGTNPKGRAACGSLPHKTGLLSTPWGWQHSQALTVSHGSTCWVGEGMSNHGNWQGPNTRPKELANTHWVLVWSHPLGCWSREGALLLKVGQLYQGPSIFNADFSLLPGRSFTRLLWFRVTSASGSHLCRQHQRYSVPCSCREPNAKPTLSL